MTAERTRTHRPEFIDGRLVCVECDSVDQRATWPCAHAAQPSPDRPASRWDDGTCGVKGCPCPHDPHQGKYPDPPCDHGMVAAAPAQTTPGARGPGGVQVTAGARSDDAVARCRTCKAHAEREART